MKYPAPLVSQLLFAGVVFEIGLLFFPLSVRLAVNLSSVFLRSKPAGNPMKYPAPLVSQLLFAGVVFEILLLDPVL